MEQEQQHSFRRLVRADLIGFGSRAAATAALMWLLIQFSDVALEGLQKEFLNPTLLADLGAWANANSRLYKVLLLAITFASLFFFVEFVAVILRMRFPEAPEATPTLTPSPTPSVTDPYGAIIDYAATLNQQNHLDHFFRVYDVFSRHLWLEGRLDARVRLGRQAEEAAAKSGDESRLVQVLIDDLGWTNVALRRYDVATDSITRGIEKARTSNLPFWAAKGLRHMAGIATLKNEHESALTLLSQSESIASALTDQAKRTEMLAGIEYAKATTLLRQRKPTDALAAIERFSNLVRQANDKTRQVRVFAIRGQAYLHAKKWGDAKEAFIKGLRAAEEMGRVDEVIRNHKGLAECYKHLDDQQQALTHESKARDLQEGTPVPYEIEAN